MIVQELRRIQDRAGYLPKPMLRTLAERLRVPLYRIHEVASFFPHFRLEEPKELEVRVCRDMACHLRGSRAMLEGLKNLDGGTHRDRVEVCGVSCLGRCDRAPAVTVTRASGGEAHGWNYLSRDPDDICDVVRRILGGEFPLPDNDAAQPDVTTSWMMDVYGREPSYEAVRRFVDEMSESSADTAVKSVIGSLETADLLGMGGAGGRSYKKWSDVLDAEGDTKSVVCNGDESEPGTFKDREILLRLPHLVIEGMIVAGLVLNARRGYVYIRHEYEEQIKAVEEAIRRAEKRGVCGDDILGTGRSFHLEVFVSPGGYICGEQTALIEAMEDKRAEPRNRPPELQTNGLWDMPTLLNNVETFAWVPAIVARERGSWFARQGAAQPSEAGFKGWRLFSVSGDVARPGVYEVPNGITLRELIENAGGMRDSRELNAVAPSGPSGGFLPRKLPVDALSPRFVQKELPAGATHFDLLDWKLDIRQARKMGVMLGGGIVIYGKEADLVEQAFACTSFFRDESCGKCVPCRIGTQKLVDLVTGLREHELGRFEVLGAGPDSMQARVEELSSVMEDTAICGLGTVAANPLRSLLRYFEGDVARRFSQPPMPV